MNCGDQFMKIILSLICFAAGLILAGIEILLPGFGLPGISAIVACLLGTYFLMAALGGAAGLLVSLLLLLLCAAVLVFFARMAVNGKFRNGKLFLNDQDLEKKENGSSAMVGLEGTAVTDLHPSGIAEIVGKRVSVVTQGEFIAAGNKIVVSSAEGSKIIVRISD